MPTFLKKIKKRIPKFFIFLCLNFVYTLFFNYFLFFVMDNESILSEEPISNIRYIIILIMAFFVAIVSRKHFKIQSYYYLFPFQSFINLTAIIIWYGINKSMSYKFFIISLVFNPLFFVLFFYYIFDKIENFKNRKAFGEETSERTEIRIVSSKYRLTYFRKIKIFFLTTILIFITILSFNINLLLLPYQMYLMVKNYLEAVNGIFFIYKNLIPFIWVYLFEIFISLFIFKKPILNFIFKSKIMSPFRNKIIPDKESINFAENIFILLYISILVSAKTLNYLVYLGLVLADFNLFFHK